MKAKEKFTIIVDIDELGIIEPTEETFNAIRNIGDAVTALGCTPYISGAFFYTNNNLTAGMLTMAVNSLFKPPISVRISTNYKDLKINISNCAS